MSPWVLTAIGIAWGVVSTLVAWGFASGRLVGSTPTRADLETLRRDLKLDQAEQLGRRDEETKRLERRIGGEHEERKRKVEDINAAMGTIRVDQRGHDERLKSLEEGVRDLRRRVYNGMAGA